MSTKPHILLVPGAWHTAHAYSKFANLLENSGYSTSTCDLISVQNPPIDGFEPDVDAIRKSLESLCGQDKDVVLFLHSYAGVVGSEAVKGFAKIERRKEGKTGGVSMIIYCTAFVLPEKQSLLGALGGEDLPWWDVKEDKTTCMPLTPEKIFYGDVDESTKKEVIASLKPMNYKSFSSKVTYAGWRDFPVGYIYCEQDQAIPVEAQKGMVEASKAQFTTESLDASHSPFLSMPEKTARCVRKLLGETV